MASAKKLTAIVSIAGTVSPSLSKSIKDAEKQISSASKTWKTFGVAAMASAAAIGAAVVKGADMLYDLGKRFDEVEDAIRVATGATGDDLNALMDDFKEVYSSVPTTMEKASEAISGYNTRLDVSGETLQQISEQALHLSNILDEDVSAVVESTSQSFQAFSLDEREMGDAMDWLYKVSQSTGVGLSDLASTAQSSAAAFKTMGFDYKEATALLAQFQKGGYDVSKIMWSMNIAAKNASKAGLTGAEAYKKYYTQIKNAASETEAINKASELFGGKGAVVMAQAIRSGAGDLETFTAELNDSAESIEKAALDTYDMSELLQLLKQKAEVALEPLARSLFQLVQDLMPVFEQLFNGGILPAIQKLVEELVPLIEQLLPKLLPALDVLVNIISELLPVLVDVITPIIGFVVDILPMLADLLAVVGEILRACAPILEAVFDIIKTAMPYVVKLAQTILPIISKILSTIAPILKLLEPLLEPLLDLTVALLEPLLDLAAAIGDAIGGALELVAPLIEGLADLLGGLIRFITDEFSGNWEQAWSGVSSIFAEVWNGLADLVRAPINLMIDIINWFLEQVNTISFDLPDWDILGEYAGAKIGFNIDMIPHLAKGGFTDGLSIAGEAGTEAVISFNRMYRTENIETWAEAGRMLMGDNSLTAVAARVLGLEDFSLESLAGDTYIVFDIGGITWAPTIEGDVADKEDLMEVLRRHEEEFMAWLEEYMEAKGAAAYA